MPATIRGSGALIGLEHVFFACIAKTSVSGECGWASSPPAHSDLCASGYALMVTTQPLGTRLGSHKHSDQLRGGLSTIQFL